MAQEYTDLQDIETRLRTSLAVLSGAERDQWRVRLLEILNEPQSTQDAPLERQAWDESPPLPPKGYDDPHYKPAIHGWRDEEHLDQLIQEGINSGPGRELTSEVWDEIRAKARARAGLD